MKTMQERLDNRFEGSIDHIAIASKENIFRFTIHQDYPSPYLTVTFGELGDLVKATAYVLEKKKKIDLTSFTRVDIVGNALPHYQLLCYALWYMRCTIIGIPPKLGNDKQEPLDERGQGKYPLKEDEYHLSAGYKGIPMFSMYQKEFCEEIYQAKLVGKCFRRQGIKEDIATIVGTSSSYRVIIKNDQCSSKYIY
ncbi:hypothetical protein U3516DRAFT_667416 [Neocallimastix sp. 'constans']